ncbi:MAG: glycosyltransferase [Planctomycetota bacterium]
MRIAHCSLEVQGVRGGGIGTYVGEAGRALRAAGHEVWLFTMRPDAELESRFRAVCDEAFDRVVFVDEDLDDPLRYRFGFARRPYRESQMVHDAIRRAGVEFDWIEFPDYEAWGYVAVQEQDLFRTHGDAVVAVHLHSPTRECWDYNLQRHNLGPKEREVCALEEDAIRRTPLLLAPSRRLREMVADRLGLAPTRLGDGEAVAEILRYPMRLSPELPASPANGRRLEDLRIVYFGRMEPRKGVHHLVEAFRQLPEVRLELFGEDRPSSPQGGSLIEWLSRDLPPNVTFRPALPRERLLAELSSFDVCIFPSLWENWPNVCLEAMAAGRVVLGAKNGGMSEMIEAGASGFLVDGTDPDDIARVIRDELGQALDRLDEIGSAAAARARELCDPAKYASRVEELHGQAVRKRQPVSPAGDLPLVTVLVPYYREDLEVVRAAVDSALAQTHQKLEVLVIEDGSPRADKDAILDALRSRDERVRVVSRTNGGLARARNQGVLEARGEFVLCLDADNLLRNDYVELGLMAFRADSSAEAIVPQFRIFDDSTNETVAVVGPLPFEPSLAYFRNEFGDAGAMFRRRVFSEHDLRYDPEVDTYSDWALWIDMARHRLPVRQVPRILFDYRKHGESMMATTAWDRHLAMVGLLMDRHWLSLGDDGDRERAVAMLHGFGVGSLLANLGGRAEFWEEPGRATRRWFQNPERFEIAHGIVELLARVPVLGSLTIGTALRLRRWHGKRKDRRAR